MNVVFVLALAALAVQDAPAASDTSRPAKQLKLEERLQAINLDEARHWEMWLDKSRTAKAELIEKPVAFWTNPTVTFGVQHGSVFLWTYEGRPIVVGSIFAHPLGMGKRRLVHEFHSLAPTALSAVCNDEQNSVWEAKSGLALEALADAPAPADTAAKRLLQMRAIGREFGGYIVDWRKERYELRLLPQPVYRYDKPPKGVIDGALLALVSNAGTDPEVFLLLEAHKDGWRYALLRFASSDLYVTRNDKEIWTAVKSPEQTQFHNPEHTYKVFHKPIIDDPAEAAEETTP
jgi:hypothetical protein